MPLLLMVYFALEWTLNHEDSELRLSVWGWAVHYCEQICGFCAYVDLQPSPQQGKRRNEEDVFPSV